MISGFGVFAFGVFESEEGIDSDEELSTVELEVGAFFATGSFAAELVAVALELGAVFAAGSLTAELVAIALELVAVFTGSLTSTGSLADASRKALCPRKAKDNNVSLRILEKIR